MNIIPDTELILTKEKKIYHLNLKKDDISENIILVGDPERVSIVSNMFDNIECKIQHREFITHTGSFCGKRITVISTGIGTDNIDIVINELDALINIDFEKRVKNDNFKRLNILRLGTSGALQHDIDVDTFITSSFGLGLDNLAHFYDQKNIIEKEMSNAYIKHTKWPEILSKPYIVKGSENLLELFKDFDTGITATAPGFYAPQGRSLRLNTSIHNMHNKMSSFKFGKYKIKNFEMETSALYFLGKSLGHNTLSICAIIGNRLSKKYSKNYKKTIEEMINIVLNRLTNNHS